MSIYTSLILLRRVKRSARRPSLSDRQDPSTHRKPSVNLRSHHKPSLINLQEPLFLQVFSVYNWYFLVLKIS